MEYLMTKAKLKELIDAFDENEIHYVIIGGFGLDALRGKLSKPHKDVDMLVLKEDYNKIKKVLEKLKYHEERYADLLLAKRQDGAEADLDMVTIEEEEILICGPNKITHVPLEIFNNTQIVELEGIILKIASNELLKLFGLWDRKGKDLEFAKSIPVNVKLFNKIRRVLKEK